MRTVPACGRAQSGRELEEGRLADPRRTGERGEARPGIQRDAGEDGGVRARVGVRHVDEADPDVAASATRVECGRGCPGDTFRTRGGEASAESRSSRMPATASAPSAAEWYSAPTRRIGQ